ncbi:MAG: methyl-accepting chemotaxis protein, partial [Alkalilacustris sp.]
MRRLALGRYRNLLLGVIAAQALALAAALAIGLQTTRGYDGMVAEYSLSRSQSAGAAAVDALLWTDHMDLVARTGAEIAREVAPLLGDRNALGTHLRDVYARGAVAGGSVDLRGVTLLDLDLQVLGMDWRDPLRIPDGGVPAGMAAALAAREGADRLRPLLRGWTADGAPRVSVAVPVGGLRLAGYAVLHIDPVVALQGMDVRLATPVRLRRLDDTPLPGPAEVAHPEGALTVPAPVTVRSPDGVDLFRADVLADRGALQAMLGVTRDRSLLAVLVAVGGLSLGIVAVLWFYLARSHRRDVAMAAEVETTRRREAEAEAARAAAAAEASEVHARVVRDLSDGLERMAAGDLSHPIPNPADDPFPEAYAALRKGYNTSLARLSDILTEVRAVGGAVQEGAADISRAAADLSHRAETQAATLEESAAALDEMTASVKSAADKAAEADGAVGTVRREADDSRAVVAATVEAMGKIEASSTQVAQIIGVIDDIAFQTNLLALNAGV